MLEVTHSNNTLPPPSAFIREHKPISCGLIHECGTDIRTWVTDTAIVVRHLLPSEMSLAFSVIQYDVLCMLENTDFAQWGIYIKCHFPYRKIE